MVQKEQKRRGRPPAYVPELALSKAIKAFWPAGFAGTSLDELAAATGMNRPSLYGAFGDKHDLYMKALEHYWAEGRDAMARALAPDRPIRAALRAVYAEALDIYFPPAGSPRGCFLITTGTTEAMHDPDVRAYLDAALREIDFQPGSMGPKVEAACRFAEATGAPAGIGALADAAAILRGERGTRVRC